MYSIQSFLRKALYFFKSCSLGWCDLQLKNRGQLKCRALSCLLSVRDVQGNVSSPDGSSLVLQDAQVFSKAPSLL